MINIKDYRLIDFSDIERIVNNKLSESKSLDYKREINLEKGDEKKDFLYDIASFANSDGGILVFGVSESKDSDGKNNGLPDEIIGLNIDNFDKLILKIEDLIHSSIEPNIPNITIKVLSNKDKNVLLIAIPKPIGLPRMVTYNNSNKFYKRRNSGKYLLDIFELNQLFMSNFELTKQIEEYRKERVQDVLNLGFISDLDPKNSTFIHIIPISYYTYNQLSLTEDLLLNSIKEKLRPIDSGSWDSRHNFEGFLLFNRNHSDRKVDSYVQLFRNGIVEFFTHAFHAENEKYKLFYLGWLESKVIESIENTIKIYKMVGVQPPFVVQISITDLQKRYVDIRGAFNIAVLPFLTNNLFIPNVLINDFDANISKELKTTFDIIWQSAGYHESPFYLDNGERKK